MNDIIRLDVTKNTFKKYIIKTGFNYNIRQYEDFISSIKRIIINEIKTSINEDNLKEKKKEIFGTEDISLDILFNKYILIKFRLSFLERLINDGTLDMFFIEETKKKNFSEKVQKRAYMYNSIFDSNLSDEKKELLSDYLGFNRNTGSNEYISMKNCLNNHGIKLSKEIKDYVYERLNLAYKKMILRKSKKSYIHRLFSIIAIYRNKEMSYYNDENILEFISLFMKGDYLSRDEIETYISLDYGTSFGIDFSDYKEISKIIFLYQRLKSRYRIYNKSLLNIFSAIIFNDIERLPSEITENSKFDSSLSIEENLNIVRVNKRKFDMCKEISDLSYKDIDDIVIDIGSTEFTIKEILNSYS